MSEFKIKVNVELDAKDLESQLKNLGEQEIDVKLNGVDKIEAQLKSLKNSFQDAFKVNGSFLNDIKKVANAIEKINSGGSSTSKSTSSTSKLVSEYKDLANTVEKIQKQLSKGLLDESSISRSNTLIEKLKGQMNDLKNEMDEVELASVKAFEGKLENKHLAEMNNYLNKIESTTASLGTKLNSISFDHIDSSKIEKIQNELKEIQDIARQDINLEMNVGDILSDLNRISNEIKNLEKVENLASSFEKVSSSVTNATSDIERLSSEIKSLENVADNLDGSFDRAFKGASSSVKDFQSSLEKVKSSSGIFGDMDDFLGNFSQFKIADLAGDAIADGIRQMATAWKDTIVETDTAITDLNKVLSEGGKLTGQSLDNYLNQVTQVAKGTGQASTDIIQGTAKAVQSGIKDTEQALKYAQQSAIFANIGDMSQEEADKILTSVMSANGGVEKSLQQTSSHLKAYGKDYSQLQEFIDMANYAGNNFSVTTKDVGTALQLSSSALSANGVSMEKQIAMATAMNEVMQDSSKTGNSLKSISANMSGVIFSLKEGDVQANKSAKALEKLTGIKLFDETTGEVMDMYNAMEQLNSKWDGLTEAQKASIAQTIAGKQNLTSFFALMDNWDTARQYVDEYNRSVGEGNKIVGSASRENEQYLDSIQGKWNSIKEDLKATGLNIINTEMAKNGLDFISSITSILPKATEKVDDFYKAFYGGNFDGEVSDFIYESLEKIDLSGKLNNLGSQISDFFSKTFGKNSKISSAISGMFDSLANNDFIGKWMSDVSTIYGKVIDKFTDIAPGVSFFRNIGNLLNNESKELENSIEGHRNRIDILKEEAQAISNQQKYIESVSEAYDKLSKNTKRTVEEEEAYLNLKNEIASQNPDLVLGYDSNGSPILKDLKLQNEQYERQNKLKQQSIRLEENALATDTQKQRLQDLEDYNKALEEYNELQLYSDTKRKDGWLTDESLQDYAKRLRENNAEIEKANLESYSKRLEDHQKYIDDERAIQEKYINQMESSNSFKKMTEDAQKNMLSFMDTLNWSEFSDSQASAFARQLESVSDKIVSTTDQMGEYSKKINEISEAYANNESNMIGYTKALGEQYELAGKLDNQSLMQWFDSLKEYGSLTGDLNGVNACINEMATSLEKVTGIDASTWKTAFEFDPAPIDASNKALQNFLKSYNTGVQNLGKGGLADKLKVEFENLQSGYLQMVNDIANNGVETIDKEYLLNIKLNQPKPVQSLIDEILADDKVTEEEINLLLNVMTEILNTGEISEETYQQIADVLDMDVQEVKAKFNINAEVDGNFEEVQKYIEQWDGIEDTDKQLLLKMIEEGGSDIEEAISKWDSLSEEEKQQTLKQLLEKEGDISEASQEFESAQEGEKKQTLSQESKGSEHLQEDNRHFQEVQEGEKKQTLSQDVVGSDKLKTGRVEFEQLQDGAKKSQTLEQKVDGSGELESGKSVWEKISEGKKILTALFKAEGKEDIENANSSLEKLPSKKDVVVEIVKKGGDLLDSITNWFNSKAQSQTIEVTAKVTGQDAVNSIKSSIESLPSSKGINVNVSVNGTNLVNALKTSISSLQNKSVTVTATVTGTNLVNALKTSISSLQGKSVTVSASVSGTNLVQALTSAINGLTGKSVSVTASVEGTDDVNALADAIDSVKSKDVSIKATTSGKSAVDSLANSIANVQSKTVSVSVTKTVTNVVKNVVDNIFKRSIPTEEGTQSINAPQTVSSSNLSSIPISASDTPISNTPSLTDTPISAKATSSGFDISKILSSIDNNVSIYKELEEVLKNIEYQLNIVDSKMENAFGEEKIQLLQRQVELYEEQQERQHELAENERAINEELKGWLSNNGFDFYGDTITNYQDKLLEMEQNVANLKARYDEANNATKKNENTVKSLQSQYESANEKLNQAKEYLDRYFESNDKIDDASEKWWDLENAISDAGKSINDTLNMSLENQIDGVADSIDFLNSKIENLTGIEKATYIRQQNELYRQQQNLLHQLAEQLRQQLSLLSSSSSEYAELSSQISDLSTQWWDLNSAIQNNQMEIFEAETYYARHEIEMLSSQIDLLDNKMNNYSGTEKIAIIEQQNALYRQQQALLHQLAEQLRQQLAMLDQASAEYKQLELEIAGLSSEWWDLESQITSNNQWVDDYYNDIYEEQQRAYEEQQRAYEEQQREAERAREEAEREAKRLAEEREQFERERWQLLIDTNLQEVTNEVEKAKNKLEELQTLFDNIQETEDLNGKKRVKNLREQIELYEDLDVQLQNQVYGLQSTLKLYQERLKGLGFKFDIDGDVTNYREKLQELKETLEDDNFSHAEGLLNDYFDILIDQLPSVKNELLSIKGQINSINDEIKDLYREQLDITKDIEDEITEIYEEEYEKRKKAIEKYTDEKIKLLKEEKDAYNDMRDAQEYEKELRDQTEEVEELRKKLEIAKRDTSIEGIKRQKELIEELEKAEEELAEMTQDKIDKDFEKNIENEIDRLEQEQDALIENLEEQFSEENIAKMVADAMSSGFIDINGEIKTIQDALIDSVNSSAEAYSVMGAVIKQELVDNLSVALDTMKELENIYKELDITEYGMVSSDILSNIPSSNYGASSKTITVGETNITINGSVSNDIINDIEELIDKKNNEMLKSISNGL